MSEEKIWNALSEIMDPEVPLNIVEMGLVYDVNYVEKNGEANIVMTLTTPGCPLHKQIDSDIQAKLMRLKEVSSVKVEFVFDPKWTIDMMTPEARKKIGK